MQNNEALKHRRKVEQEIPFSEMTLRLMEEWGDGMPTFAADDPKNPEWKETPIVTLDLHADGVVHVKDESDRASNPTGTIKDRAAWELATLYRDYARALYLKLMAGSITKHEIETKAVPRISFITSGNEGMAVAECFKKYNLPPPKLIIDENIDSGVKGEILKLRADVYSTDLSHELSQRDIREISNNTKGIDIASPLVFRPEAIFYDWHVHEAFNFEPDKIFVPYGSGRLTENYLYWQIRSMRNEGNHARDPRLKANLEKVISTDILAAEPESIDSVADKLNARFKPFTIFKDRDIESLRQIELTGRESGIEKVNEDFIIEAHEILKKHGILAEPSSAASLALYLDRFRQGLINPDEKILIINTGEGLTQEDSTMRQKIQKTLEH